MPILQPGRGEQQRPQQNHDHHHPPDRGHPSGASRISHQGHIHAQNAEQLNRAEQWEEWLRLHRKALAAFDEGDQVRRKAALNRAEEVLASPPVKEADFRPLERELTELLSAGSDAADVLREPDSSIPRPRSTTLCCTDIWG
jgi:hypothetical protein